MPRAPSCERGCSARIPACRNSNRLPNVHVSMVTAGRTVSCLEEVTERPAPAAQERLHVERCGGALCVCLHARAQLRVGVELQQVVVSKALQDLDQAFQSKHVAPVRPIVHRCVTAKPLEGGVSKVDHTHLHPGGLLGLRCEGLQAGRRTGGVRVWTRRGERGKN